MRILIVEDNKERIDFFKRVYKNHELYITDNVFDAHRFVHDKEFDIMFLDHDLEPDNFKALKEGKTGYDFVKLLIEDKQQIHAIIYVHSMNPVGGQAMVNLLKDNNYEAQWVPFHLLKLEDR